MTDRVHDLSCIPLEEIRAAAPILTEYGVYRTPLVALNHDVPGKKIYLKLENMQPVGSFKIRGAVNAISAVPKDKLRHGVCATSSGNFGQGLAWAARQMGVPCKIVCPDTAPKVKVDAIKRYGADVITVPYDTWWSVMESGRYDDVNGHFINQVGNRHVIAGNGTSGLEILEDLPDVDTVVCPWGAGGNATGIASALSILKPKVKVIACEPARAAPLAASLKAGRLSLAENFQTSFVDGMNGENVFPSMWNLAKNLVSDSVMVSLEDICESIKFILDRNHVIAEGAGAASVAAALKDQVPPGNIVCIVTGGNLQTEYLNNILQGAVPA